MKVASLYFSSLKTLSLTHAEPPKSAKEPGALRAAVHEAPLRAMVKGTQIICRFSEQMHGMGRRDGLILYATGIIKCEVDGDILVAIPFLGECERDL